MENKKKYHTFLSPFSHRLLHINKRITAVYCALILVAVIFAVLFVNTYSKLKASIQNERIDYITELSRSMIYSQNSMVKQYTSTAESCATIIENIRFKSLAEVDMAFSGFHTRSTLLVNTEGRIIDLGGNAVFVSDNNVAYELSATDRTIQLFASLNGRADYWLFAVPINDVVIAGETYVTFIFAVPIDEVRDHLAVTMFEGAGASYIVTGSGSVELKPRSANAPFTGYNLLSALESSGVDPETVAEIKVELNYGLTRNRTIIINDSQWIISYAPIDADTRLVVTVPLTLTAGDTFKGMTRVIIYAAMTVLTLSMSALAIFLFFSRTDRERSKAAAAAQARSDFFSKMSHDIRTPLNAIVGMELLAEDNLDNPERAREYLARSSAAAGYLISIVNDVMDLSRMENGTIPINKQPFDLAESLNDVERIISALAIKKEISLTVSDKTDGNIHYRGDGLRIKQVLINLLSNAVKFTPCGGSVALLVKKTPRHNNTDELTFVINDNGIGMSDEYLKKLFTPFEQEDAAHDPQSPGSGLGLAITHNLVTLMDGTISVESKKNHGTSFTVVLPLERVETPPPTVVEPTTLRTFDGRRVLLAEDNELNTQIVVALLTNKFNMVVETAVNGKQALDMFAASVPRYYDVILMDVRMPVMDGLEATRAIRALNKGDAKSVPIIALSANSFESDVMLSLAAGMNCHLSKPIIVREISDALAAQLPVFTPPPPEKN